jgi:hypothetical protein
MHKIKKHAALAVIAPVLLLMLAGCNEDPPNLVRYPPNRIQGNTAVFNGCCHVYTEYPPAGYGHGYYGPILSPGSSDYRDSGRHSGLQTYGGASWR